MNDFQTNIKNEKRFIFSWIFGPKKQESPSNEKDQQSQKIEIETQEEREIREASENGNPIAQFHYSQLLAFKNDFQGSFHWLKLSANSRQYPLSIITMAECYLEGHLGVKKDLEMATYWYRVAAELNDPYAMVTLSRLLIGKMETEPGGKNSESYASCM